MNPKGEKGGRTLRDRLSRLTFKEACGLLGPGGEKLLRTGGAEEVELPGRVIVEDDLFRLRLEEATVTVTLSEERPGKLRVACSACAHPCEHAGAALALLLEEKLSLGLAAPPRERIPIESLGEEDLIAQALRERAERAATEKMKMTSLAPQALWTDYVVTNLASGKSYHVALRGAERGDSYCSCPDFRKNTLGTCKHLLFVTGRLKKKFGPEAWRASYRVKNVEVHLRYGETTDLRILVPEGLSREAMALLRPLIGKAIEDAGDLLRRIRKLEALGQEVTVYPDAEEYIGKDLFQKRIGRLIGEIRSDPGSHPLRKTLLKRELLPYQLDGIAFAAGAGRAVLADDMGLGKTIQGIGVAELLAREAGISKVLIVCPTSLKSHWRIEIGQCSNRNCQLVLGTAKERANLYGAEVFFTLCNYEQVLRDINAIERVKWDLIILDEGQRIKNWEAKTSRTMKALRSPFALVLSGTPLENRLEELFSVVEFIDERRLGPAFRFYNRHRVVDERGKTLGYRNLDELRERLKPVLLRRTRKQVMMELPPRTTEIRRIPPTEEQLDVHNAQRKIIRRIITKPYLTEMDLLRLQKALLLCRMAANSTFLVDKMPPGYSSKIEELDLLLEQLAAEEDRKILLFSEWTTMLDLIEPLLETRGLSYVRLDGSIPQQKRQGLIARFQGDPRCRLFITTNAGATGLNLQAANTVINVDLPWNPALLEQRISRAHRMGQKRPVQVFLLVTENTLEENLLGTLSAKHELALAALDPESKVSAVDLVSGIEELKRRLEVLLGQTPEAPLDESLKAQAEKEAEAVARRNRIATAGGQLLQAAFAMLGEILPQREETDETRRLAGTLSEGLRQGLERDAEGRLRLSITLPDESVLDGMASSLARLFGAAGPR